MHSFQKGAPFEVKGLIGSPGSRGSNDTYAFCGTVGIADVNLCGGRQCAPQCRALEIETKQIRLSVQPTHAVVEFDDIAAGVPGSMQRDPRADSSIHARVRNDFAIEHIEVSG